MACFPGWRAQALARAQTRALARALARAQARQEQERYIVYLRESAYISAPCEIAVTGVVIAMKVQSVQSTIISSEEAVMYETAAAIVASSAV